MEIKLWILTALTCVFYTAIFWSFRHFIGRVNNKFDELIKAVNNLSIAEATQNEKLHNLGKRIDANDNRLNDHSKRLRMVEGRQSACLQQQNKTA